MWFPKKPRVTGLSYSLCDALSLVSLGASSLLSAQHFNLVSVFHASLLNSNIMMLSLLFPLFSGNGVRFLRLFPSPSSLTRSGKCCVDLM